MKQTINLLFSMEHTVHPYLKTVGTGTFSDLIPGSEVPDCIFFVQTAMLAWPLNPTLHNGTETTKSGSLSDLFLRVVFPSIINTLGEVLDEADALSYADLFLLRQLGGQTGLTGCGVVHGHVSLFLV